MLYADINRDLIYVYDCAMRGKWMPFKEFVESLLDQQPHRS